MKYSYWAGKSVRRMAAVLAAVLVFAFVPGAMALASSAPVTFFARSGNVLECEGFSDGYVWATVSDTNFDRYHVCVDKNGRAVVMVSEDVSPDRPQSMENGYTYIENGGDWETKQVAILNRNGSIISTFSSRANNHILAMGYGYILAVESPNVSGFDMSATGMCTYKIYDPEGQVVFQREYEGSGSDLPVDGKYYGGGVFSIGSEFYFAQTGATADLSGLEKTRWLSFYEGPWCLSVVESGQEQVLLVMNTSGEWWTEPLGNVSDSSRSLVWRDKDTGDVYFYDVHTKQWNTLGKYADRMEKAYAWIDGAALTMKGDDGKDYFAIYDSQWNMLSPEPTLGSVIDAWDGTVLVQTDADNEQTIISNGEILNTSDKVIAIYDGATGQQRPGTLYGNAVPHPDYSWGSGDSYRGGSAGDKFFINDGVICIDSEPDQCYDTAGNYLFAPNSVDFSQTQDMSGLLQEAWEEDAGSESALVVHWTFPAKPTVETPDAAVLAEALLGACETEVTVSTPDDQYAWPMSVYSAEDRQCVASSNTGVDNSYSDVQLQFTAEDGAVFAVDYKISSDQYDCATIALDGEPLKTLGGEEDWRTFSYTLTGGAHTVTLSYVKDMDTAGGDDQVWFDDFRVVTGAAADALAAEPQFPFAEKTTITVDDPDAREIFFDDPDGWLLDDFADARFFIVPDEFTVSATLTADYDPDATKFDYEMVDTFSEVLLSKAVDGERYTAVFSGIDTVETTGVCYSVVYLGTDYETIGQVVVFADEQNVDFFAQEYMGGQVSWAYAEGEAQAASAQTAEDTTAVDTAAEDWYTRLGNFQSYYGAIGYFGDYAIPSIVVLSYAGDCIEMRSDTLAFLNDFALTPTSRSEEAWVYPGISWTEDSLTYYPADGSVGVNNGAEVSVHQPMLEHGPQYALPDGLAEDWYLNVGEAMYVAEDEYTEIGLLFTDEGNGSFKAVMLPVDEFTFRADTCEGTPAGGVYYAGDRGELYYYPEYSTAFVVLPEGGVYEFWFG